MDDRYYETRIKSVEDRIDNNDRYFRKVEETLEKFAEMNSSQIVLLHETIGRLEANANDIQKISAVHEERLSQHDGDIKDVIGQIQTVHGRIDSVKSDIASWKERSDRRLMEMEKWRWVVIGGISIAVFAVSNWSRIGAIVGSFAG